MLFVPLLVSYDVCVGAGVSVVVGVGVVVSVVVEGLPLGVGD